MIKIEINDNEEKEELTIEINKKKVTIIEKYFAEKISKYIDKLIAENIK